MILLIIGIVEMFVVTIWTKTVSNTQILASGVVTMVNVLIWYYVLQQIVEDIGNWQLAVLYALGCALGTVLATYFYKLSENRKALSEK